MSSNFTFQFDEALLPFNSEGPTETPPIEGYDGPDGDYKDVSKIWWNCPLYISI